MGAAPLEGIAVRLIKIEPIPKLLSTAIGCKVRGSALSAKRILDVLQYVSEPFSPPALTTNFSLDLATKQVLGWILLTLVFILNLAVSDAYSQSGQAGQKSTVIIVVGGGGTKEYKAQFTQSADIWQQACTKGNTKSIVIGLDETSVSEDRTAIEQILKNEPNQTKIVLWLVLIGHGTFDGRTAKFNLRGPDLSAEDLAEWLKPFQRPVAVINTASSSAPFLSKLSGENRILITATKSGYELNYTRFGQYFAEAIADPQADLDKDGQTSLLEAFLTASNKVVQFYLAAGQLVTEHALLDDNGDGLGTPADWFRGIRPVKKARDDTSLDGYRAHQLYLVQSEAENKTPPHIRAERDRLELEVIKLRDTKETFSEDEYYSRLEKLLYQIAQIYEQIDETDKKSM